MFFIDDLPLIGRTINKYHQSPGFFNQTRKLDWVSGAALFIRKSVFKQVGGWNETIFMYGEDVDLCSQAKAKGWQIWTLSTTKITHIGQGSGHHGQALTGEISWLVDYFSANKPRYQLPLIKAILKAGALLRAYLFGKIMHKKEYYELYRKAATLAG
jgi:GT2 family glycosyltransferase